MRVLGCGYATPYLRAFHGEAERVLAVMPAAQGAHQWPAGKQKGEKERNLVCLSEEAELPFENSSIDRILLVHHLEFSESLQPFLEEIWRVLKADGRILVIVPNRSGLWARADWSPFGQGTPYNASQITYYLHDNGFVHERTQEALFLPPLKMTLLLKSARWLERFGPMILPFVSGVHIVEASKQVFARVDRGSRSRVKIRGRGSFVGRPVPQGFSHMHHK